MGLTGALREVSLKTCPHCKKEYGRHSKKQFMKCLYTANYNLYHVVKQYNEQKEELDKIKSDKVAKEEKVEIEEGELIDPKVS